ncbi:LysR substrate-binding domain-containing protein [Streptomonospora wellingtoniae]|uniref:LysR substrate-binding domain-containing protein n=1 Tax=Streptomonospora wellingtoniae TaxID=3075544 RepID=A0ABU2KTG5_9ACTN|nr:LysR substrate-binding domain-containing protein [Streptomonospora sp. DSM 45055]MDT0302582.1 LysR substrate-binding domain-containing protein [Streptomonospora sp. DSM 45055]
MLDADRVRVLVEVAHAGSIAAAAERMSFTAPALSQQLTKLEREVGCALVERSRTGVRLTRAGRVLLAYGERVVGELRDAEVAVRAAAGEAQVRLSLGAFASAGKLLVPGALAAFGQAHPQVRLSLSDVEPPDGYGLVTSGELDLLITHRYPGVQPPASTGLHRERILVDPLLLVLPEGHPAAGAAPRLADLTDQEWICGAPGISNRVALESAAADEGVRLPVAYETRDYEVMLALIRAGVGIGLVPRMILDAAPGGGWVAAPPGGAALAREISIVHRRRPPAPVPAMVDMLRRSARRPPH